MLTIQAVRCRSSRFACVAGLLLFAVAACSDVGVDGAGGDGGSAGAGGVGGESGAGGGIACEGNLCACSEAGIRAAIAEGGGPFTFDCDGPTTVVTQAEIVIDNDVILDGEGVLTVDGEEHHTVMTVSEDASVEVRGFAVTRGAASGVWNRGTLTMTNSTVSNTAGGAVLDGAISNFGALTVTNSVVSRNSGPGISNGGTLIVKNSTVSENATPAFGGGIVNIGTLTVTNSVVSGNTASYPELGSGVANESLGPMAITNSTGSRKSLRDTELGSGGGIANLESGRMTITNSTVSGNTASGPGGGIANFGRGPVTITNSTVSGNTASGSGGGISNHPGPLTLANSVVQGACEGEYYYSDGYNVESPDDTCGFNRASDQVSVSADELKLGQLADNGGPTMTQALLRGSVAIDVIPPEMCEVDEDQRGVTRPQGPACDVGAFELEVMP